MQKWWQIGKFDHTDDESWCGKKRRKLKTKLSKIYFGGVEKGSKYGILDGRSKRRQLTMFTWLFDRHSLQIWSASNPTYFYIYFESYLLRHLLVMFLWTYFRYPKRNNFFYRRGYFKKRKQKQERKVVSTISALIPLIIPWNHIMIANK